MTLESRNFGFYEIKENTLTHNSYHVYDITVDQQFAAGDKGLKVTLAWDDATASNLTDLTELKLVNNLGAFLRAPNGEIYYPWSIDLPYDIYAAGNAPHLIEPEPIVGSDIVPARRDVPNDRDNVEVVQVDSINFDQVGTWELYVVDNGMAGVLPQKYSIVVSQWNAERQCHLCLFAAED